MSDTASTTPPRRGFLSSLGPAIITASVVLGPGSILANSTTGQRFGYDLAWVLMIAVLLMIGMTALSTRLGVLMSGSMGQEIRHRAGGGWAILVGLTIFLVASCFQFSNNLGILFSIEPLFETESKAVKYAALVTMNLLCIAALLFARDLYRNIERMMKILVGLMVLGFVTNLIMTRPSLIGIANGFVPKLPEGAAQSLFPRRGAADVLQPVVAMIGTTFSIAAAYYQSYLVRQKGWTVADYRTGIVDTLLGIGMLGFISLVIMCTASAAFFGNPDVTFPAKPTAADFARQLEPTFGAGAKYLFCLGIFAGAFSSFLVNALIGGALFSDGCGLGGRMEDRPVRLFTIAALSLGMIVAGYTVAQGEPPGGLILFAQAMTVLGSPLVAAMLLWLALQRDLRPRIPKVLIGVAVVTLCFTLFLAARTAVGVYLALTP